MPPDHSFKALRSIHRASVKKKIRELKKQNSRAGVDVISAKLLGEGAGSAFAKRLYTFLFGTSAPAVIAVAEEEIAPVQVKWEGYYPDDDAEGLEIDEFMRGEAHHDYYPDISRFDELRDSASEYDRKVYSKLQQSVGEYGNASEMLDKDLRGDLLNYHRSGRVVDKEEFSRKAKEDYLRRKGNVDHTRERYTKRKNKADQYLAEKSLLDNAATSSDRRERKPSVKAKENQAARK